METCHRAVPKQARVFAEPHSRDVRRLRRADSIARRQSTSECRDWNEGGKKGALLSLDTEAVKRSDYTPTPEEPNNVSKDAFR